MAILSQALIETVQDQLVQYGDLPPRVMNQNGAFVSGKPSLTGLPEIAQRRRYALQASIDRGAPFVFYVAPSIISWVVALEDQRVVRASLLGHEFFVDAERGDRDAAVHDLIHQGMAPSFAQQYVESLPRAAQPSIEAAAQRASTCFYQQSGWRPILMEERRQELRRQRQLSEAEQEGRLREGEGYGVAKERILLTCIRAGDRNGARRLLNEMLAAIYLSSPKPVVLRARVIELLSCLTRAAIEDNPMLEPLIERNHRWMDHLIRAEGFETLSTVLMKALDEFIDAVHLHGVNRSNVHVQRALDCIARNYREPISLADVARDVGLSSSRLAHLVKAFTGKTVLEVIREVRLRKAQELLDQTTMSGVEIAYEVGFNDQSYFIQHFRRFTGMTPARYRRRQS